MLFTIIITLVVLSLIFHESGHWYEMYRYNIPIAEAGLGLPISRKLQIRFKLKRWPNTVFTLNPLLLGAYVKPSDAGVKKMEALPYAKNASIFGAGPLANIIFYLVFSVVAGLVTPNINYTNPHNLIIWSCFLVLAIIIFLARKYISCVLPALATAVLIYSFYIMARNHISPRDGVAGPVGIVRLAQLASIQLANALNFTAFISLNLGLFNALPIFPLDGGRIVDPLLKKWPRLRAFTQHIGIILLYIFIFYAITNDCIKH